MASDDEAAVSFATLGLRAELCEQLAALDHQTPTPVQVAAIPILLAGTDLIGQAATGTGKTAAFSLPLLHRMDARNGRHPRLLVLTPTRELAVQVAGAIGDYADRLDVAVTAIFGGQPIGPQIRDLRRGVDVVVATPGRALDHLNRGTLSFEDIEAVVLDEADEMLDMGFAEELEALLDATPAMRQTALFSATMPPRAEAIAQRHLHEPATFDLTGARAPDDLALHEQVAYIVDQRHKAAALGRILELEQPEGTIVFCRTRDDVDTVAEQLLARGLRAEPLHGGMSQEQRDRALDRLRNRRTEILVATDVAARGLDVAHLSHVVNHDVPTSTDAYVHRIGRVGRAGRAGVAITLADPRAKRRLRDLERATRAKIATRPVPSADEVASHRLRQRIQAGLSAMDDPSLDGVLVHLDEAAIGDVRRFAAAVLQGSARAGVDDEVDIPPVADRGASRDSRGRDRGARKPQRGDKASGDRGRGGDRGRPQRRLDGPTSKIWVGAGKRDGVRPGDLVGAITGETSLSGNQVGGITVLEKFSIVELPADSVDEVVDKMRRGSIRGKKVPVRRDRQDR